MRQFRPAELAAYLRAGNTPVLLDVREPWEWDVCRLPDAILIPMRELPARLAELNQAAQTVVICHHGVRSFRAARYLESAGFGDVINLSGGVAAWADEVDPAMPRY
ncbi:MAG: rhodanese-like domain-containing protein [Thiobacillus sp.]|jgi:rhodanese-related sulfurtransferase|uniref:rhodanese-like domain-containing protein n=1 Tax=Thiobacillus sp. TaxID=924 RepID=UPI00289489F5|nr:rhodanese-like domain-containing protein [Thiobacillus sp.]MDT3705975.1 rhodanese-like domain-containing protein [Thiobacillus sp.]